MAKTCLSSKVEQMLKDLKMDTRTKYQYTGRSLPPSPTLVRFCDAFADLFWPPHSAVSSQINDHVAIKSNSFGIKD